MCSVGFLNVTVRVIENIGLFWLAHALLGSLHLLEEDAVKEAKWEMQEMVCEGLLPQFTMEEAVMELVLEAKCWAEVELECVMRLDDETGRVEDEINKLRELIVEIIQHRDDAESRQRLSREIIRRRHYITQIKESVSAIQSELDTIRTIGQPWLKIRKPCQAMGSQGAYCH